MKASAENIKIGNTIIFTYLEYDEVEEYDGIVQAIDKNGVRVVYLNGYKSRNDFILWCDVLAKLDKRKPWVTLSNSVYNGQFLEFTD